VRRTIVSLLALLPSVTGCNCDDNLGALKASVQVMPSQLDFGSLEIGSMKQLPLTLKNVGTFTLTIDSYTADAPFIAPSETGTIATGTTATVLVGFKPTALGAAMGNLVIVDSYMKVPMVTVPLTGTGIQAAVKVDPLMIDFGDVLWDPRPMPGTTTVALHRTVTVTNPGTDKFDLTSIALVDDGGGTFTMNPMGVQKTYAPNDSASFDVAYYPKALGATTGKVEIKTNAPGGADIMVSLAANAVGPVLQICAKTSSQTAETCTTNGALPHLQFQVDPHGMDSGSFRVLNTGTRPLTISQTYLAIPMQGALTFNPAIPSSTPIIVMPNGSTSWTVTYAPPDFSSTAVVIGFVSDSVFAQPNSLRIDGRVRSPTIEVDPEIATFNLFAGTPSDTTVRIHDCGDSPLTLGTISGMQTSGQMGAISFQNLPSNMTLQPENPCPGAGGVGFVIHVGAAPAGMYTAEVNVPSDDPNRPLVQVMITVRLQ
jgi:hypothetical protein